VSRSPEDTFFTVFIHKQCTIKALRVELLLLVAAATAALVVE
jgi:hypothetical protein